MTMRVAAIETNPVVKPVSTVAADQMPMPAAFIALPPKRSTSRPTGSRQSTYIHRNDDSSQPISTFDRPNSAEIGVTATDSATRSV